MTQLQVLLKHLKSGKGITTLMAHRGGICSLSSRICELMRAGHKIRKVPRKVTSRFGTVRVIEYRLASKQTVHSPKESV